MLSGKYAYHFQFPLNDLCRNDISLVGILASGSEDQGLETRFHERSAVFKGLVYVKSFDGQMSLPSVGGVRKYQRRHLTSFEKGR
ncbi:hypothetical protein AVEN_77124-1 [Araneus ventricosus]|uniref:Uncharacterized protein n=1 Tax=Araneus ventricosus TaxID=182803 RepID=A0A4Y2IPH1_ARAVE|nr:hypothetical protein AVEN_77124-1 [Araneus ventricosus]